MAINIRSSINIRPKPAQYIMDRALEKAVEMALLFNQPLLLTGEPGTGKTQLAYRVAWELSQQKAAGQQCQFGEKPLRFNTKTTSTARDLFYTYDAVGHFQEANIKKDGAATKTTKDFLELQALGEAIALANPQAAYADKFRWKAPTAARSSVVLIDEIDKAPRDFSNDLLNELENLEFFIKEQDSYEVKMGDNNPQRILIIMTSNSEKNLPDAFLRRCVFYNIPFPDGDKLHKIIEAQLEGTIQPQTKATLREVTSLFKKIRKEAPRKKPATAELVAFIKALEADGLLENKAPKVKDWYKNNLALLVKTKEDIKTISDFLDQQA